ncbi:MAG: TIGR02646 family protein, partial [Coleofasciculus sp. Co-bin14]|nr:TIGR02646 family protein [Coleofasciculus sp. Co-bin14]
MRYINKGKEPESLTKWKALANEDWTPTYDGLCGQEKTDLYNALLREQGFICCYCGMRISRENSDIDEDTSETGKDTCHIEHLKPQSVYPELALEYKNLLASCQAERDTVPRPPVRCGYKKGDWYDNHQMVSPLDENCANFFRYSASGEILPTDELDKQEAAKTSIEKLGLDIEKLRLMRSAPIDGALLAIEGLTDEEIQIFAQD